jgi:long-subunit acyl-CoA synthetase (AMP-forming)
VAQAEFDLMPGAAGSLITGTKAKLIDSNGKEVTAYEERGELLMQSPSIALGYLDNDKSSAETFVWDKDGRWLRTGDEVIVTKSPLGNEQLVVVDRLKELIKVKVRVPSWG